MVHSLRPLSASARRTLLAPLVMALALAPPAVAAEKSSGDAPTTPAANCSLLDQPQDRRSSGRPAQVPRQELRSRGRVHLAASAPARAMPANWPTPPRRPTSRSATRRGHLGHAPRARPRSRSTRRPARSARATTTRPRRDPRTPAFPASARPTAARPSTDRGAVSSSSYGDPSMVWRKSDGYFYYVTLRERSRNLPVDGRLPDVHQSQRSHSGGWDDKEILAVDNNPASPYYGCLYVVWTDFGAGQVISVHLLDRRRHDLVAPRHASQRRRTRRARGRRWRPTATCT